MAKLRNIGRQNGLRLSHCLKAIPQIPCLLSAPWVVDSVTLAVNGTKHFCPQIKPCWNIKKIGPNRVWLDCCLVAVSFWGGGEVGVIVPRQWLLHTCETVALGESHWADFLLKERDKKANISFQSFGLTTQNINKIFWKQNWQMVWGPSKILERIFFFKVIIHFYEKWKNHSSLHCKNLL